MRSVTQIIFFILSLTVSLHPFDIAKKYPSYTYVFNEFDVDKSYIYDSEFTEFVFKNEEGLMQFYRRSLQRGKEVLPMMKGLLLTEGVSDLFIYLSMIESGFSSTAVSPKKAVGLWQFMPATAKNYNLTVCNSYDERCDASSATGAAIAYLNKLYRQFGKWYLAAMAYNCGEGCVQHAIAEANTDDLTILTDERLKYIPKETRDYIKKILLVAMIGENSTLGFGTVQNDALENSLIEVEISGDTSLKKVAKLIKMKYEVLHKLNRKMKYAMDSKHDAQKKYKIIIPLEKVFAFYLRYELSDDEKPAKPHLISHYVALGDTLSSIATKYKAEVDDIMRVNHLKDEYLTLEQLLVIPVSQMVFESTLVGTFK